MNYELTQGTTNGVLFDLYFSPVGSEIEDGIPYVIDASIQGSSETEFVDGPAQISFNGQSFPVVLSVAEFDAEEADDEDAEENEEEDGDDEEVPACYLSIASETLTIEGLAELLELTEVGSDG